MAEAQEIAVGQTVRFKGYSDEVSEPLLHPGDLVRVRSINADGGLIIDMLDAEGNVRTDVSETDTLFPEEVEIITVAEADAANDVANAPDAPEEDPVDLERSLGADEFTPMSEEELAAQAIRPSVVAAEPALPVVNATMKVKDLTAIAKAEGVTVKGLKGAQALVDAIVARREATAEVLTDEAPVENADAPDTSTATAEAAPEVTQEAPPAKIKPVAQSGKSPKAKGNAGTGRAADMGSGPRASDMMTDDQVGPRSELVRAALASVSTSDENEGSAALLAAKTLVNRVDETYYTLGGVLSYIKETGVYKSLGYDGKRGFGDYCKAELGTDYRKSQYLIDVYEKVQAAGLNEKRLSEIGWSKAVQVVRVGDRNIEKLAEDFDELVDFAKDHSRDELVSHIQQNYEVARRNTASSEEKVNVSTFIFKLAADAASSAERALQHAKRQTGSDDLSEAFKYICDDWSMMTEGTTISLEDAMAVLEQRFGVTITATAANGDTIGEGEEQTEEVAAE